MWGKSLDLGESSRFSRQLVQYFHCEGQHLSKQLSSPGALGSDTVFYAVGSSLLIYAVGSRLRVWLLGWALWWLFWHRQCCGSSQLAQVWPVGAARAGDCQMNAENCCVEGSGKGVIKTILVSLSLGKWSRLGTSWEIMKEQDRVWAAILTLCCLCPFLN